MPRLILVRPAAILLATATVAAGQQSALRTPHSPVTTSARATPRPTSPRLLSGARNSGFTTIQGNALDAANAQLPNATVRLRDARFGQIVGTELTDKSGMFAFRSVDPGTYIVEMMANDDSSVLAASEILNVNAGEVILAIVKLPLRTSTFAGVLGANSTPTAAALLTQAAASGVVAVVATDPVSPIE